jgi:hypothetical protein
MAARQTRVNMAAGLSRIRGAAEETSILEASIDYWSWCSPSGVAAADAMQRACDSMEECALLCRGMAPAEVKAWVQQRAYAKVPPPTLSAVGTFATFNIAGSGADCAGSSAADSWFRADFSTVGAKAKPRPPGLPAEYAAAEAARMAVDAAFAASLPVDPAGAKSPPRGLLSGPLPPPAKGPPSGFSGFTASSDLPAKAMPRSTPAVLPIKAAPAGSTPPSSAVASSWMPLGAPSVLPVKAPPARVKAPRLPFLF